MARLFPLVNTVVPISDPDPDDHLDSPVSSSCSSDGVQYLPKSG